MHLLEDILRVLGVAGREAEKIMSEMHNLANSRGARRLIMLLPQQARQELDESMESAASGEHEEIIRKVIHGNCSEQQRQQAYTQALWEIVREEFLPAILKEATPAQRLEIERLISL